MTNTDDYKNKDFSVHINDSKKGIEIRRNNEMTEEQILEIKDAGFRWSKRQQLWYSYQNEKSFAYVEKLKKNYESNEIDNHISEEITVEKLAELIKQREELDKKITAFKKVINESTEEKVFSSEQENELSAAMKASEKAEEHTSVSNSSAIGLVEQTEKENIVSDSENAELTIDDLDVAKKFIPDNEYATLIDNATHGEESDYFKEKIKHVAEICRQLYKNKDGKSFNTDTKQHDKGYVHYFIADSDWYISEVDDNDVCFGYAVLNGNTQNSEYGYIDLNEITSLNIKNLIQPELDIYCDDTVSMEQAIAEKFPELKDRLFRSEIEINESRNEKKVSEKENKFNTVDITSDNFEMLEIKNGSIVKDNEGKYWRVTQTGDFIGNIILCDENGADVDTTGVKSQMKVGGGLKALLTEKGKSFSLQNKITEKDIKKITYYVRTSDEYDPETVRAGLSAEEAVNLAYDLTLKESEHPAEYGWQRKSYGICVYSPGHFIFDDEEMSGGFQCVRADIEHDNLNKLAIDNTIFDQDLSDPVRIQAKIELEKALQNYEIKHSVNNSLNADTKDSLLSDREESQKKETGTKKIILKKYTDNSGNDKNYESEDKSIYIQHLENVEKGNPEYKVLQIDEKNKVQHVMFYADTKDEILENLKDPTWNIDASYEEKYSIKESENVRDEIKRILDKNTDEVISNSPEYLKLLAKYEGGGGLKVENRTTAEVLNAFYTPRNIVNAVWQIADHYAPDAKTVLEPSSGIGRFAEKHETDKQITMREIDQTSARIAKLLHPKTTVIQGAFQSQFFDITGRIHNEKTELPKYDIVIGNPPYGAYSNEWKGRGEGKEHNRIEEYFIEKGLDSLKDDKSVLAFVVPSGWLRSGKDKVKNIIANKGTLIDAYRLPNKAFDTTDIGTDIIIMKKSVKELEENQDRSVVLYNDTFFKNNPDKVLGKESVRSGRFGPEPCVNLPDGLTLDDVLSLIPSHMTEKSDIKNALLDNNDESTTASNASEKKNKFSYITSDGLINADLLRDGDIVIDKESSIPYKASMVFGDNFIRFTSITMKDKTANETLFDELNDPTYSKEEMTELGIGWKKVINERYTVPTDEQLNKWKYPSWYKKHIDEQNAYNKERDIIREPLLSMAEAPVHAYAEICAKEIDWICSRQDEDEYGFARPHHEIAEICNFYGSDIVKAVINNSVNYFAEQSKYEKENYSRLKKEYTKFFEEAEELSINKDINDVRCDEGKSGHKFGKGNSLWDITREFVNGVKDNAIKEKVIQPSLKKKVVSDSIKEKTDKKTEIMTAEDFSKLYDRDFKPEEIPIWQSTDWEGVIDKSKLSLKEEEILHSSSDYIEFEPHKFTHKILFESGAIGEKITYYQDKIEKSEETGENNPDTALYQKNLELLKTVLPKRIPLERLHFGLNTTLSEEFMIPHETAAGETVELNLQESFILWAQGQTYKSSLADEHYYRSGIDFTVSNISEEDLPSNVSWYDIIDYIDKKPVKAEKTNSWRKDEEEIQADKAQHRKEADEKRMARSETADRLFDKYLHEGLSPELSKRVESEYNRRFNSYVNPDYSKLPLFIDGMSRLKDGKKFKLYDQQIKGVSFLCNKGNGLLAYDVGVGKTAAGIVATINQIQTGRCTRPVIVVPNSVYSKWNKDIHDLFPDVKVNDLYNLNKESTEKYRNKENPHKLDIPENSVSLVTYEALKNITFTDNSCENELFDDYSKLLSVDFDSTNVENAKNADNIKNVIGAASQVKNTNFVFFEDCGFDNITVDEAHNFKNLWTVPRSKNKGESNEFSGIPTGKPSSRALKLFAMTQLTQRHNENRNVFLLTATPFTNSPLEVYSMMSYVGRKRLIDSGLYSLRDFCNQFAHTKLELGVNSKGEVDQKQVMKDWKELPALQNLLTEYIDKVDGEELKEIIRPRKFTHVQQLEMSDLQKKMMQIDTDKMSEVKEGNSAAVIVSMNAMRLALVAPALADPARYPGISIPEKKLLVETSPKLKFVCDSVIDMYKNHPEKGQFIYLPLGQEAHGIMKDYLIDHGLPKDAVEIINGSVNGTTEKKEKITGMFNDPGCKCKILIGGKNTSEGIDLNGNSFAMYNCSLGWNPSETIQAEGRIWRQGNMQGHVHCVYPVMNDSIDALLYQKHDEKRSRINEIWTYKKGDTLNVEDINPEELKFELIKDPQKRATMIFDNETKNIKNELNKIEMRLKSFDEIYEKNADLKKDLAEVEFNIKKYEHQGEEYKAQNLEIPEWCKSEIKDNKKFKESYTRQLDTITRKFNSWGITDETDLNNFIPEMNKKKHLLEEQIERKKDEMPDILERETLKMQENKITLPSVEQQRKVLTDEILSNMKSMETVEPEIRTERFEQMLENKWQKSEITTEEKNTYLSDGYKKYYESLEQEDGKKEEILQNKEYTPEDNYISKSLDATEVNPNGIVIQGSLFDEEDMTQIKEYEDSYQLITYSEEAGIDYKNEYLTITDAQKEGNNWIENWELDKKNNGFVVYNQQSNKIELNYGYFPEEELLQFDSYKRNNTIPDIPNQLKDLISEKADNSKEWTNNHLIISRPGIKKQGIER